MRRSPRLTLLLVPTLLVLATSQLSAQGTLDDYQRAQDLQKRVANTVHRQGVRPRWFADDRGAVLQPSSLVRTCASMNVRFTPERAKSVAAGC